MSGREIVHSGVVDLQLSAGNRDAVEKAPKARIVVCQFRGATTMDAWPLAAGLLVASARSDVRIDRAATFDIVVGREAPEAVVARFDRPAIAAFSCYSWNARYALEVARLTRRAHPGCVIVVGGPSVPRRPAQAQRFLDSHPWVDVLARGEGELTFKAIVRAVLEATPLPGIPGTVVRGEDGLLHFGPDRPRIADFAETASPYLDGTFDALGFALGWPFGVAVFETNRGCPFSCSFCDWGQATQSRVHELPLQRLRDELDWIAARRVPYLYIVDANFGIRKRDRTILDHVAKLRRTTGVPAYCFFHLTKNATTRNLEVIEALRDADIGTQVALSMQDFDANVLEAVQRKNIKVDESLALRAACNARGIPTLNEILLGLPGQTYATLRSTMVSAISPHPRDSFFVHLCRVLENAELASDAQRARFGLVTRLCEAGSTHGRRRDPHVVEVEEIVVATDTLPHEDWARAFRFAYLLAAGHNLGLMDLIVHFLVHTCRAAAPRRSSEAAHGAPQQLSSWLEHVLAEMALAAPDAPLGRVWATMERYIASISTGGPMVLELDGSEHGWNVEEGIVLTALRDPDAAIPRPPEQAGEARDAGRPADFFDALAVCSERWLVAQRTMELKDATPLPTPELLRELVRLQAFVTPTLARSARDTCTFQHDWQGCFLAVLERGEQPSLEALLASGTSMATYEPPPHVVHSRSWRDFFASHAALMYGRSPRTWVWWSSSRSPDPPST